MWPRVVVKGREARERVSSSAAGLARERTSIVAVKEKGVANNCVVQF